MEKKAKDYLHTKRGLLAMLLGFRNEDITVVEAIEKAPSLALSTGGSTFTIGEDPEMYDTLMDYAYPILYA